MKPSRFEYVRPDSLPDALELLAEHGADAAVLAGGQSLMPMMNLRLAAPAVLVDIGRIPDLDLVQVSATHLTIAAGATHAELLRSPVVAEHAPLLARALPHVAHAAIRNRGTLGGSLALADPAAELPACMVCLDAEIRLRSVRGERTVGAGRFFKGVYDTDRAADELLVSVSVPRRPADWRFSFHEVVRRRGDFALAGLAFAARLDGGRVEDCRLAYCGIEAAPRRVETAEAYLTRAGLAVHGDARHVVANALDPQSSTQYPASYRRRLATVLLDRALDDVTKERVHGRA